MKQNRTFGLMNGHAVGIILKELVRRAIRAIRNERQAYEVTGKTGYDGGHDIFTSADTAAQKVYVRSLRECFPEFGIVAEENSLVVPSAMGFHAYFTVDPLDGTKAFVRGQSDGVGTMIALVMDGEVVSAYVGDVNTQEIFGFRPDSFHSYRITDFEVAEELQLSAGKPIADQYIILRDRESVYSDRGREMIGRFKNITVTGGSIGTWMARLWKREVAAALLPPAPRETPWDSSPVVGISQALGYRFLRPTGLNSWEIYTPTISTIGVSREHDTLVIHKDDVPQIAECLV